MDLFNKVKGKVLKTFTSQCAKDFKSAYLSSNLEDMEKNLDGLRNCYELKESDSERFFYYYALGIYIIVSAVKNPPIGKNIIILMDVTSKIKRLNRIQLTNNVEKELSDWFYQEFDKLVKSQNYTGYLNWKG